MEIEHDLSDAFFALAEWARFAKGRICAGWSSNSITGALMDQYEVGIRNEGDFATEHIPERVAVTDAIISKLPGSTKKVITIYWMNCTAPREVHGNIYGCTGRHFVRLYDAAILVFASRLISSRLAA